MALRKLIFRVRVIMDDNTGPSFTIATHSKTRLPELIDRNRLFIEQAGTIMKRWELVDEYTHTLTMPDERYRQEIEYCDIIDGEI